MGDESMDNLDDFLNTNEAPVEAVEPAVTPETTTEPEATPEPAAEPAEAKAARARDDKGRFAPKGDNVDAPPASEGIPVKALQEERRKRQELEQQLQELQARLQQPQQPAPDIWEDTQGWQQHFGGEVVNTAVQTAVENAALKTSEMIARQAHEDFDQIWTEMNAFLVENPSLVQKAKADPHPWGFAYKAYKNHQRMQDLGAVDVGDLEARLREQIRAELEAQYKAPAAPTNPTPPVPDTLADAQSARGSSGSTINVPTLDEILKR